ncbi:hypothetical protein [Actinotalea sp. C106]|uniref:hypothetical protein n=1 Tax=Actinotalea sp. C106 TaxID=2908644 RepID=UPI0020279D7F|nr:hypothetical protein [Actinotalea sp. C106]
MSTTKRVFTRAAVIVGLAVAGTIGAGSAASAFTCVTWPASQNDHGVDETRCDNGEFQIIIFG